MGAERQDTSGEDSGAEAVAVLVENMRSPTTNDATRIDAIREIFDRGYGKPGSMDNMNDELDTVQK